MPGNARPRLLLREQSRADFRADEVAGRVAEDGRQAQRRDQPLDRPPGHVGDQAGGDQQRVAGQEKGEQPRLHEHDQADGRQAAGLDQAPDVGEAMQQFLYMVQARRRITHFGIVCI